MAESLSILSLPLTLVIHLFGPHALLSNYSVLFSGPSSGVLKLNFISRDNKHVTYNDKVSSTVTL